MGDGAVALSTAGAHGAAGCGGLHRRPPTGCAANGIPRNAHDEPRSRPWTSPLPVVTRHETPCLYVPRVDRWPVAAQPIARVNIFTSLVMSASLFHPRASNMEAPCDTVFGRPWEFRGFSMRRRTTVTLSAGVRLGPYEIFSLLGVGGMGEVYKARDTRLDRAVAVKLLRGELAERPDHRERFRIEARAISSLSHPHICALLDVGEQDGPAFPVMEYLEGETLNDRPHRRTSSRGRCCRLCDSDRRCARQRTP